MDNLKHMYRYVQHHDENMSTITLQTFEVIRQTDKTCWIKRGYDEDSLFTGTSDIKRVSKEPGLKQPFAHPTKREALYAFKMRKQRYMRILNHTKKVVAYTVVVCDRLLKEDADYTSKVISHYDI